MTATDERPGITADEYAEVFAELLDEADALRGALDEARRVVVEQSAALDRALASRLDWWADGYRAGFVAGDEVGARRAGREWQITARNVGRYDVGQHGPTYAQLDRLRYPPHGRVSWMLPNLGDLWASWSALDAAEDGGQR